MKLNKKWFVVGLIVPWILHLCILYTVSIYSHAIYPRQVIVQVYDSIKHTNNIVIEWQQASQANRACISKQSAGNYILIGCQNTQLGYNIFSTRNYVDGNYKHQDGDVYFIEEYFDNHVDTYGPYEAFYTFELPRIDR